MRCVFYNHAGSIFGVLGAFVSDGVVRKETRTIPRSHIKLHEKF